MDKAPFSYTIKNYDIVLELIERGFTLVDDGTNSELWQSSVSDSWAVRAPEHYSTSKAKKIISTIIRLYSAAKERSRAQIRYEQLLCELEYLERQ